MRRKLPLADSSTAGILPAGSARAVRCDQHVNRKHLNLKGYSQNSRCDEFVESNETLRSRHRPDFAAKEQ
eukprot:6753105-Pyramimonas_sp.AAC.2